MKRSRKMLCHELSRLALESREAYRDREFYPYSFRPDALHNGSNIEEPKVRPDCPFGADSLDIIHIGKEASIVSMIEGGNGFPTRICSNHQAEVMFDLGCQQERRDARSWLAWDKSLAQCMSDRKNGRVEG
jgi:hypothetical protein